MSSIKLNWSAANLASNYIKCLVGYDLRRKSAMQTVFLTSDDSDACYEDLWVQHAEFRYSLNLYSVFPQKINGFVMPKEAVVVAFDLPLSLAEEINNKNFSASTLSIELVSVKSEWKFLGYDVADAVRQYSAFYGFDWNKEEFDGIVKSTAVKLNEYGIVDDQESATKLAIVFDKLIPEHSPFAPCGVWLKIK
jgi:hypothetical protein